jgi:hypothetical protein
MTLAQLLAELRGNILNDRSDRVSGSSDYLWTDETLVTYIDEAQRRLAREGLVIRDGSTAEVVDVTLATGVSKYTLHPSIIAVVSARYEDDVADLPRVGHWFLSGYRMPDNVMFDINRVATLTPGKPLAFATDEEHAQDENGSQSLITLRTYPEPTADYNTKKIKLRVLRMPIERLDLKKKKFQVPEVPEEHHIDMLDWAAYLALRIQDQDAGNAKSAETFRLSFTAMTRDAKRNAIRKLFAPMGWGFGQNGWSWER